MDEWIKKMWDINIYICICIYIYTHKHTMVFDSATGKNEILPFATIWIDLDVIMVK